MKVKFWVALLAGCFAVAAFTPRAAAQQRPFYQ